MASLLVKLVVSNRSLSVFRPVVTSSSRLFNAKPLGDNRDSEDNIPTFIRTCPPFISYLITNAHRPHLSVTRNLTRQLNMMDDQIVIQGFTPGNRTRWSVNDDEEGLSLVCNMYQLYERDENDSVPTRDWESLLHLTHFDTPCQNWDVIKEAKELNQFVQSMSGLHAISFVRVFCTTRYIPAIYIVFGHEGPDPWDPCGGYIAKICLPRKFYRIEDVYAEMYYKALRIVIPKKDTEKPIYKIERNLLFFRERKSQ